jgi:hypothetical protein
MTIALSTLVSQLQSLVPAVDGVPTTAQYERIVRQAVADFSRQTDPPTQTEIAVVAGTATYALPDDFLRLISFKPESSCTYQSWWDTGYPYADGWGYGYNQVCDPCGERYDIRGTTLTIFPTPTSDETRVLRYGWQHVLNASDEYEYLDSDGEAVRIVLLKAQAEALRILAVQESAGGTKVRAYSQGDVSVQLNAQVRAGDLRDAVKALQQEYDDAIAQFNELASGWCGWYQ